MNKSMTNKFSLDKTNQSILQENSRRVQYEFHLDIDIRQIREKYIKKTKGKLIFDVEWINHDGPSIILVEYLGIKAQQTNSYYIELSCHPHIVRTYGFVQSNRQSMMILQEDSPQGNLYELLCKNEFQPNEFVLYQIFEQISDGMIYLIDRNIIHGNLICENILLFQINPINPKKNFIKLTDFAFTNISQLYSIIDYSQTNMINTISTRYAAPELLENIHQMSYSEKSDIYSMGILMWQACNYGQIPYEHINEIETIRLLKIQGELLPKPSRCNDYLWNIIENCCHIQPTQRPTFRLLKENLHQLTLQSINKFQSNITSNSIDINISDPTIISLPLEKNDDQIDQEQYFSDDGSIDIQQINNDTTLNTNVRCPFCEQHFSSLINLHDHLIQCGTKTDQCPKCQQFIQRAIFAYHYENNCAQINQITSEISSSNNQSSEFFTCQFCQNNYTQTDYQMHKDYCLNNPVNQNLTNKQRSVASRSSVGIPCEFCQMNYSIQQFHEHQESCSKNPNRIKSSRISNNPHHHDNVQISTDNPNENLSTIQQTDVNSTNTNQDENICCTCL